MANRRRIYWDSSCFICLINKDSEPERHQICADILNHAQNEEEIEIWTSCWTIAETIRPRDPFTIPFLPEWSKHLDAVDKFNGEPIYPGARDRFQRIWDYYHWNTRPARILPPEQAQKIRQMFAWSWIKKIQLGPVVAARAAEIARETNLKPCDSLHVASALFRGCSVIQRWDRDFKKTDHLIGSCDPTMISEPTLFPIEK